MLKALQNKNPHLKILEITSPEFKKYGQILSAEPFAELFERMNATPVPEEGNVYVASDGELEKAAVFKELESNFYGEMPVQIGYCNGQNTKINALEYHRGEEINLAATDLALFLGQVQNLKDDTLSTDELECFFVPKGTVYTMYQTTLHFSPCKVHKDGFRCAVILPRGTNMPLPEGVKQIFETDRTLWMTNKWLIGHAESRPVSNGAFCGLTGENYELIPLED
jgi:hypothetical protein